MIKDKIIKAIQEFDVKQDQFHKLLRLSEEEIEAILSDEMDASDAYNLEGVLHRTIFLSEGYSHHTPYERIKLIINSP